MHPPPPRVVQIFCKMCKCANVQAEQTVLRLCKHPAGCTRLCKYSAEVAVVVQTSSGCAGCSRLCKYSAEVAAGCTNPLQVVQTFCSNDTSATHTHGPPTTPDTFSISDFFRRQFFHHSGLRPDCCACSSVCFHSR